MVWQLFLAVAEFVRIRPRVVHGTLTSSATFPAARIPFGEKHLGCSAAAGVRPAAAQKLEKDGADFLSGAQKLER